MRILWGGSGPIPDLSYFDWLNSDMGGANPIVDVSYFGFLRNSCGATSYPRGVGVTTGSGSFVSYIYIYIHNTFMYGLNRLGAIGELASLVFCQDQCRTRFSL